jgi:hypothetical protein
LSFTLYVIGFLVLIGGLGYGAVILHVPQRWIAVGGVILLGLAILTGVTATRQKDKADKRTDTPRSIDWPPFGLRLTPLAATTSIPPLAAAAPPGPRVSPSATIYAQIKRIGPVEPLHRNHIFFCACGLLGPG